MTQASTDYTQPSSSVSARMSKVGTKNTAPEMLVRKFLYGQGLRYRLHSKNLVGKPDIVLPKYKTIIFIHGCFWHQHNVGCGKNLTPKANASYWQAKLSLNVVRDKENQQALEAAGWRVLVVWECELKRANRGATLAKLTAEILQQEMIWEYLQAA